LETVPQHITDRKSREVSFSTLINKVQHDLTTRFEISITIIIITITITLTTITITIIIKLIITITIKYKK